MERATVSGTGGRAFGLIALQLDDPPPLKDSEPSGTEAGRPSETDRASATSDSEALQHQIQGVVRFKPAPLAGRRHVEDVAFELVDVSLPAEEYPREIHI